MWRCNHAVDQRRCSGATAVYSAAAVEVRYNQYGGGTDALLDVSLSPIVSRLRCDTPSTIFISTVGYTSGKVPKTEYEWPGIGDVRGYL